jgi:hypothetical protein
MCAAAPRVPPDTMGPFSEHVANCKAGNHMIARHDTMLDAMETLLKLAGLQYKREYRATIQGMGNGGPDFFINRVGLFEFGIVNPASKNYAERAARQAQWAADYREAEKYTKYIDQATEAGMQLHVGVMEVYGTMSNGMTAIISNMAKAFELRLGQLPTTTTYTAPTFAAYARQVMGTALVKARAGMAGKVLHNRELAKADVRATGMFAHDPRLHTTTRKQDQPRVPIQFAATTRIEQASRTERTRRNNQSAGPEQVTQKDSANGDHLRIRRQQDGEEPTPRTEPTTAHTTSNTDPASALTSVRTASTQGSQQPQDQDDAAQQLAEGSSFQIMRVTVNR